MSLRRMLKQVLPKTALTKLDAEHPIFREPFKLEGVPKVVDLYKGPPQAFGAKVGDRLAVVYTYDTDVPCAWERYPDGSYVHVIDDKASTCWSMPCVNISVRPLPRRRSRSPEFCRLPGPWTRPTSRTSR